jgi:hypothetical protein
LGRLRDVLSPDRKVGGLCHWIIATRRDRQTTIGCKRTTHPLNKRSSRQRDLLAQLSHCVFGSRAFSGPSPAWPLVISASPCRKDYSAILGCGSGVRSVHGAADAVDASLAFGAKPLHRQACRVGTVHTAGSQPGLIPLAAARPPPPPWRP